MPSVRLTPPQSVHVEPSVAYVPSGHKSAFVSNHVQATVNGGLPVPPLVLVPHTCDRTSTWVNVPELFLYVDMPAYAL